MANNLLGYNVQVQQCCGYWYTCAYETEYEYAVRFENVLKHLNIKTRIYAIKV